MHNINLVYNTMTTMTACRCGMIDMLLDGLCADCFWEEEAYRKKGYRLDPHWIFQRRYSALIQLEKKPPEEAWKLCMQGWIQYHIGRHLGMSHTEALNLQTST